MNVASHPRCGWPKSPKTWLEQVSQELVGASPPGSGLSKSPKKGMGQVFQEAVGASPSSSVWSKSSKKWFFLYGFAKNEKDNINDDELVHLQGAANRLMNLTDRDIEKVILIGELKELTNNA